VIWDAIVVAIFGVLMLVSAGPSSRARQEQQNQDDATMLRGVRAMRGIGILLLVVAALFFIYGR
jgi:drug/metabolite transporter (DMT)-like permease